MNRIIEGSNPERDTAIFESVRGGVAMQDVAEAHSITVSRVRQIVRRAAKAETFALFIADSTQKIEIAEVQTSRGFEHACRLAMREYSATFARLELPSWRFVAGKNTVALCDLIN